MSTATRRVLATPSEPHIISLWVWRAQGVRGFVHSWPKALRYHEEAKEHVESRLRDGKLAGDLERIQKSVKEGQLTRAGIEDALRVTVASLGREGDKHAAAELLGDIYRSEPDIVDLIVASGAIITRHPS